MNNKKISLSGRFFSSWNTICYNFRTFIRDNESIFTIFFSLIFSLEQIILLYLVYKFGGINNFLQFVIGVFIVFILFTFLLERIILEVRNKAFKKMIFIRELRYKDVLLEKNEILNKYRLLEQEVENYLKIKSNKKIS